MESTECIAAQVTASTILLHSSRCAALVAVRTADSTTAGVSRSVAVVVMGLLNQPPPTVLGACMPLCTRDLGTSASLSPRSRYARWRSLLDHRNQPRSRLANRILGGRVGKAPWRLTVSRPHPRRAA